MMRGIKILLCVLCLSSTGQALFAQSNPNLDLTEGNFNHWELSTGPRSSCCPVPGAQGNSHLLITAPGGDGLTGGMLPKLPPGAARAARLGDPSGGGYGNARAYRMRYAIHVSADSAVLHLRLAAVLAHLHGTSALGLEQTYAEIRVTDQGGAPVAAGECGHFKLYTTKPGTAFSFLGQVGWLPWNAIAVDLSGYAGQTVYLELTAHDCFTGEHGNAYVYFTAAMQPASLDVPYCRGATRVVLRAPPEFNAYTWSTGDTGQSLTVANPTPGAVFTCTQRSFNGCESIITYTLKPEDPEPSFTHSWTGACRELTFTDATSDSCVGWSWDFGDPLSGSLNTATGRSAAHTFTAPGTYAVTLNVVTASGCKATKQLPVAIGQGSIPDFSFDDVCFGKPVALHDASAGIVSGWSWSLGDGSQASGPFVEHRYTAAGSYWVTLTTTADDGCRDSIRKEVFVYPLPAAAFDVFAEPALRSDALVRFRNRSSGAMTYAWDFGNGTHSQEEQGTAVYPDKGTYDVVLRATSDRGCADTARRSVRVYDGYYIPNAFSPNGDGRNDVFRLLWLESWYFYECRVFNRWGQQVFFSSDPRSGWDGAWQGKVQEAGSYRYLISVGLPDGGERQYKGDVLLLR